MHPNPPSPKPNVRQVILCDESGRPTGSADLLEAHTGGGWRHLAFSVYVFTPDRRKLLIQQRSGKKMLWPLAWANTCCSHPRQGESAIVAGRRRLREEMGIDCELTLGPAFIYRAVDPQGRGVEHEYDVTLIGIHAGDPAPDPNEVEAWNWIDLKQLQSDMAGKRDKFAPWFHRGLPKVLADARNSGEFA